MKSLVVFLLSMILSLTGCGSDVTIAFSEYLDPATISESDFGIDGGSVGFGNFNLANNRIVTFTSNSTLNGSEKINVSGTIKDRIGNSHNNGISISYNIGG